MTHICISSVNIWILSYFVFAGSYNVDMQMLGVLFLAVNDLTVDCVSHAGFYLEHK